LLPLQALRSLILQAARQRPGPPRDHVLAHGLVRSTKPLLVRALLLRLPRQALDATWLGSELLLLLAAHPVSGIKNDAVVDMLWEEEPSDPSAALRKRRCRQYGSREQLVDGQQCQDK
jgi:hypothetical protein